MWITKKFFFFLSLFYTHTYTRAHTHTCTLSPSLSFVKCSIIVLYALHNETIFANDINNNFYFIHTFSYEKKYVTNF